MTCKTRELAQPGLRWRAEAVDEVTFPVSRNRCVNGQLQGNVAGVAATVEPVLGQAAVLEDVELKSLGSGGRSSDILDRRGAQGRQAVKHAELLGSARHGRLTPGVKQFR